MIASDLIAFLPEALLAAGILFAILFGAFAGDKSTGAVAVGGIVLLLVAALMTVTQVHDGRLFFNELLTQNGLTRFGKTLVLLAAALSLYMALPYMQRKRNQRFEFPLLYLFATLGMLLLVSANDLMSLYLGLELMSLSLYVIAALRRDMLRASEAGLKYFVLGALSSGMILYGASIIYGYAGATNFDAIAAALTVQDGANVGLLFGLTFLIAGLAFKVSAVPFHMWTPDVYQGAPAPVTAFFAAAPKVAAMIVFVRVLVEPFGALTPAWQQIIALIAMASMIVGAFAALAQTNIKRLMAYSSIANMGYALMGLAAGTADGVRGVLVYMSVYVIMTLGTFAVILTMRRDDRPVEEIDNLKGLFGQRPGLATAMTLLLFSLAGIPPLAGFFGKFLVFWAAIEVGGGLMIAMAVIGALTSVIAAFYYLRIIKLMVFDTADQELDKKTPWQWTATAMVAAVALILLTLGMQWLIGWSELAASPVLVATQVTAVSG